MSDEDLLEIANQVRKNAHAPYSNYCVGAAILDDQLQVHVACNVENAALPLGTCAEANAIAAMVASGGKEIRVIVIVGGFSGPESCPPCGGCRQRIQEFAGTQTRILLLNGSGQLEAHNIQELLPKSFKF
ncbi:MAG: cytidine deaminase [Pseudomonadales bacterium]|nr:cytidine deaminase [Pseudomonadales bacterium]